MNRRPSLQAAPLGRYAPVSVIIPCLDCETTIHRAIDSVAQQTVKPFEVIVIDDASAGSTSHCLDELAVHHNRLRENWLTVIHLHRQKGPSGARNAGWCQATGDYIAFLDADDAWHPRKIEIQYTSMQARPEVALSGHDTVWQSSSMTAPVFKQNVRLKRIRPMRQIVSNQFHTRSVMVRRDVPFRFEASKRYSEDYLLWSEIILNGRLGVHIDLPLAYTFKPQYGASGLSGDLWKMEKGEIGTYCRLYQKGLISFLQLFAVIPFSLFKYTRRIVLTASRTE